MKVGLFLDRNMRENRIAEALNALKVFGQNTFDDFSIYPHNVFKPCDLAIMWGISSKWKHNTKHRNRILSECKRRKIPIIIIELGFIKRNIYYALGWNSIVGFGYYHIVTPQSPDRFNQLSIKVKPYIGNYNDNNNDNDNNIHTDILICGQVPWDTQLDHINYKDWLTNIVKEIKKYSNRKIIYRPHPKQKAKNPMAILSLPGTINSTNKSIEDDFKTAHAVVAFNSNSLLEAMIEGIPFFAFDHGSIVYDLANHNISQIESPNFPDNQTRLQKLYNIAHTQWNANEIAQGLFWPNLKEGMLKSIELRN